MKSPEQRADRQENEHRGKPRPAVCDGEPRKECANEAHHRSDREVDTSARNHERGADTDKREEGGATEEVLDINRREKAVVENVRHDARRYEEEEESEILFHAATC